MLACWGGEQPRGGNSPGTARGHSVFLKGRGTARGHSVFLKGRKVERGQLLNGGAPKGGHERGRGTDQTSRLIGPRPLSRPSPFAAKSPDRSPSPFAVVHLTGQRMPHPSAPLPLGSSTARGP